MNELVNISFEDFIERVSLTDGFEENFFVSEFSYRYRKPSKQIMPPVRFNATTFLLCTNGELSLSIDYKEYLIKRNMLLWLNCLHIIDNLTVNNCLEGYVIVLSPQFTDSIGIEIMRSATSLLKGISDPETGSSLLLPVVELDEAEIHCLANIIERIIKMRRNTSHAFQSYMLRNEVTNLILETLNIRIERNKNRITPYESERKEEVIRKFIRLLLAHCKEHHEVSFYANELCMTAGNLSRITKAYSGKRTIKWINDVLITESKILIRKSNNSIQQVADELHFADQSSFCKHTGMTPKEYRKRVQKQDVS